MIDISNIIKEWTRQVEIHATTLGFSSAQRWLASVPELANFQPSFSIWKSGRVKPSVTAFLLIEQHRTGVDYFGGRK